MASSSSSKKISLSKQYQLLADENFSKKEYEAALAYYQKAIDFDLTKKTQLIVQHYIQCAECCHHLKNEKLLIHYIEHIFLTISLDEFNEYAALLFLNKIINSLLPDKISKAIEYVSKAEIAYTHDISAHYEVSILFFHLNMISQAESDNRIALIKCVEKLKSYQKKAVLEQEKNEEVLQSYLLLNFLCYKMSLHLGLIQNGLAYFHEAMNLIHREYKYLDVALTVHILKNFATCFNERARHISSHECKFLLQEALNALHAALEICDGILIDRMSNTLMRPILLSQICHCNQSLLSIVHHEHHPDEPRLKAEIDSYKLALLVTLYPEGELHSKELHPLLRDLFTYEEVMKIFVEEKLKTPEEKVTEPLKNSLISARESWTTSPGGSTTASTSSQTDMMKFGLT